jgi:hypothetical protein
LATLRRADGVISALAVCARPLAFRMRIADPETDELASPSAMPKNGADVLPPKMKPRPDLVVT